MEDNTKLREDNDELKKEIKQLREEIRKDREAHSQQIATLVKALAPFASHP